LPQPNDGFFSSSRPPLDLFIICIAIASTTKKTSASSLGVAVGRIIIYHQGSARGTIPIIVAPLWFGAASLCGPSPQSCAVNDVPYRNAGDRSGSCQRFVRGSAADPIGRGFVPVAGPMARRASFSRCRHRRQQLERNDGKTAKPFHQLRV